MIQGYFYSTLSQPKKKIVTFYSIIINKTVQESWS